ncbi:MAG: response regulator [Eubacteriales bacterium]|nr:response regulator [Eubacteriales bacterium]MDD3883195.1 response regulator [Eubacteriales bacterium]MDD4513334.1 response regulator [Eubacteriales bacterium]
MKRVLIVDDEPIIVEGLLAVLSAQKDMDLDLYGANSGAEALALLSEVRMDAVISDIRMPGMDGLALMEKIHADWPQCRVIFLSGYNEFDTVYQAMQSRAVTFLLKTEGFDKIISVLKQTFEDIERERTEIDDKERFYAQQALTRHMLQREALSALVMGESGVSISQSLSAAGLSLCEDEGVLVLYAYVEDGAAGLTLEQFNERLVEVDQALRGQLSPYPITGAFWNKRDDLLWFFQPREKLTPERAAVYVKENLEIIQEASKRDAGLSLAFALASEPCRLTELRDVYMALRLRVCQGTGIPGMIALSPAVKPECDGQLIPSAMLERLHELMEHQNRREFLAQFDKAAAGLAKMKSMNDPYALEAYLGLSQMILSFVNRWRLHERVSFPGGLKGLAATDGFASWEQAVSALRTLSESLLQETDSAQDSRADSIMRRIKSYINENLSDSDALSLVRIADMAYFNPTYLSRLFRQTTGETISDYISAARVHRANEMLRSQKHRIGEIGIAVGFSSSANFTRFYRKMMGCTPQEYRDRLSEQ